MPGRNELCPCGSGRKYKRCCLNAMPCHCCGLKKPLQDLRILGGLWLRGASARACVPCIEEAARDEADGKEA